MQGRMDAVSWCGAEKAFKDKRYCIWQGLEIHAEFFGCTLKPSCSPLRPASSHGGESDLGARFLPSPLLVGWGTNDQGEFRLQQV